MMPLDALVDINMKIHELYSDESKWCQGTFAKDQDGKDVGANQPEAVCWCLVGASLKCYPSEIEAYRIRKKIKEAVSPPTMNSNLFYISDWNDTPKRQFSEVRELVLRLDV
jgi:hypothetical protein